MRKPSLHHCSGSSCGICCLRMSAVNGSRRRIAKLSESQRSRSRSRSRNAPKEPMQNTIAKKQVRQEDVDSDYLFYKFLATPSLLLRFLRCSSPDALHAIASGTVLLRADSFSKFSATFNG